MKKNVKKNKKSKKDKKDKKTQKDKNKIIEKDEKNKNNKNDVNFKNLKIWYNGYKFKDDFLNEYYEIYSPYSYSIIKALRFNKIMDYWCYSGTFYSLSKYIEMNFFGLKEDIILLRNGIKIKINISSYQNDMKTFIFKDDVFTMLVHLGYLAYDADTKQVYIPNKEIMNVFKTVTSGPMWSTIAKRYKDNMILVSINYNKEINNENENYKYHSCKIERFKE